MKYNSSKFQVRKAFSLPHLTMSQIKELRLIADVLAKYMIVDRDILNYRAKKKIGLSHLQRAINYDFIVELKNLENEEDGYFYTLGLGGINFLSNDGERYHSFRLRDVFEEKNKVLMSNYHAMKNNYDLLFSSKNDMRNYNYFYCKNSKNRNLILYFEDEISIDEIKKILEKEYLRNNRSEVPITQEQLSKYLSTFMFEAIELTPSTFNDQMRVDISSYKAQLLAKKRFEFKE